MRVQRQVREGERLPPGYGVAWHDPHCWCAICYPVPFHRLIGWIRRVYLEYLRPPKRPQIDKLRIELARADASREHFEARCEFLAAEVQLLREREEEDIRRGRQITRRLLEGDTFPEWGEMGSSDRDQEDSGDG